MLGNYGKLNKTWIISLEQRNIMMIWHDSWQYVIDIRHMTSRHDFISITFDICFLLYVAVSELEPWFYFYFARYLGREIHFKLTIADWVTFTHTFTCDLEIEGHVMVYVTFVISACICAAAMIFFCFVRFFGHSNYCLSRDSHVIPWNSGSRHGLRDICYFWAKVCVLPQWFFLFFSGQGIYSDYCHLRDHHVWPWNVRSRHGLRALTTLKKKKKVT